ncbi:MAG: hypothetical protein AMXMBFR64_06980 [Myxococcales bacterium]
MDRRRLAGIPATTFEQWVLVPELLRPVPEAGLNPGVPLVGYIFADHLTGLRMWAETACTIGPGGRVEATGPRFGRQGTTMLIIQFGCWDPDTVRVLRSAERRALRLEDPPGWLSHYNSARYTAFRQEEALDRFRADGYPDDVQVILAVGSGQPERVWIRLEETVLGDLWVGTLLNQPAQGHLGVQRGDMVWVERVFAGDCGEEALVSTGVAEWDGEGATDQRAEWEIAANEARRYRDEGDLVRAVQMLRQALQHRPDDPELYTELAMLYRRGDDPIKAEGMFRWAVSASDEAPWTVVNLSTFLGECGRVEEGLDRVRPLVDALRCRAPLGDEKARIHLPGAELTMAWLLSEQGHHEEARDLAHRWVDHEEHGEFARGLLGVDDDQEGESD